MALQVHSASEVHNAALLLAQTAKTVGVPQDSLSRFLSAGYVPQPKQLEFHAAARSCDLPNGPNRIGIGGARGGAKSHAVLAQVVIDDCQRTAGLKFLFLRKVLKAARESFDDLRRRVLMGLPHDYRRNEGLLVLKNDSRVVLGHYQNEKDIEAYLGLEYDGVAIEEATQLSEDKVKDIVSCIRTAKTDWRPREYYTTNPGGIGHAWFKRDFIEPAQKESETSTRFIFSTYKDNAFLNPDYAANLGRLTGWKLRAWRDGDWDIAAGQFFSTWRRNEVVKDVRVMPGAPVWCSLDYGFQHPTVCYLFSEYDGKKQVIDEHWRQHALVSENAEDIKNMLARHGITIGQLKHFVAGPDVFAQRGTASGKTIADEYRDEGINLTPANTDRINGAARILRLLGSPPEIAPRLEISGRCERLIECLPNMQHDPHRPEDILKVDVDDDGNGGDDSYDAVRYGLLTERRDRYSESESETWGFSTY
jgi:PBSX family phage terminase large subunit